MSHSSISVLESRWWHTGNHSVRDLFSAISAIHYNNPSASLYDMFADKHSLGAILNLRAADNQTEVIYLATHGDQNNIGASARHVISRTEFRNQIVAANTHSQIKGLYLGTCLTGNKDTADFLFSAQTNLNWIAGYRDSVDWIDGSAIDMIFFHKLTTLYVKNKSKRKGKLTPEELAHNAASEMLKLVPGAHTSYGFNMYFKSNGNGVQAMFL